MTGVLDLTRPREGADLEVAIIGAGFAGLGLAVRLKEAGFTDFRIFERADELGGTWRENTYPGCQCDVPSSLYSFSFAPNPEWSRSFPLQAEIWDYMRACASRYGVTPYIRFGHEVRAARWDDELARWELETAGGVHTARILVAGTGTLVEPRVPELPGIDRFRGAKLHSAGWDHDCPLDGKRVGVVGTGASAVQIVPSIQPRVRHLTVFQRTPPWVLPHGDRPRSSRQRWLLRRLPLVQRAQRAAQYWVREALIAPGLIRNQALLRPFEWIARRHLRSQVADPELRAKLTPTYRLGCKRITPSNRWYPALTAPNVALVDAAVTALTATGAVDARGEEHELDVLIFATGFAVSPLPIAERVWGRGGVRLSESWRQGMHAYKGMTVPGFPNLFLVLGPNTNTGHASALFMLESAFNYVVDAVRVLRRQRVRALEVRPEVEAAWNSALQARLARGVWNRGGCGSWYLDAEGRNTTVWPDFSWRFRQLTRRFDVESYRSPATAPLVEEVAA